MTPKLFSELGISTDVLKAIDKLGFEQAAPIQAEAIPVLLQGRDVVGQSQTGSGKTAAFAIPAVEKVDPAKRAVQVLVLCPTRELAVQVAEEVHKLAIFKRGVHALPIYGGQSYERQFAGLRAGAQIVIGTPGRVMDHMRRLTLRLDAVKMVILDEADVMLDMGFREDIEFILQGVPAERQTVFFCATLPNAILDLIKTYARDPQQVRIQQKTLTVPTVEQIYYEVDRRFKVELLTRLVDIHDLKCGIIFCNTKRMVDDLVDHLNAQGYSADGLHGDMSQNLRDRVMNKFRRSDLEFLVATDVAARGIDVDDVQVVFNYDLPYDVEDYVHRIGRTGRAGRSGMAISFVSGREMFQIQTIERYTKMRIQRARVPTPDEVEEARACVFLDEVRDILQGKTFKQHDHLVERLLEEGFTSTDVASALIHLMQGPDAPAREGRQDSRSQPEAGPRSEPRPARKPAVVQPPMERRPASLPPTRVQKSVPPTPVRPPAPVPPAAPDEPAQLVHQPAPAAVQKATLPAPAPTAPPSEPAAAVARIKPAPHSAPKPWSTRKPSLPPYFGKAKPGLKGSEARVPASRRTPASQTRLFMSIGEEMGVGADDIRRAIQGQTGLPADVIGTVDIRERHLFVDVAAEHANSIISKLNRSKIQHHKIKVKVA